MGQNFKQIIHRRVNITVFIRKREGKNWFLSGSVRRQHLRQALDDYLVCDCRKGDARHGEGKSNFSKGIEVGKHRTIGKQKSGEKFM